MDRGKGSMSGKKVDESNLSLPNPSESEPLVGRSGDLERVVFQLGCFTMYMYCFVMALVTT